MGKPYQKEILELPETYRFALHCQIDGLVRATKAAVAGPLIAVGSGGSLSAAHFASMLHQITCGKMAKAMTPMESNMFRLTGMDTSFLLLSAGGGNPDILDAFRAIVVEEPLRLGVLTARPATKLSRLVARYRYVDYFEVPPPSGRDGFLATNSLLSFCVVLSRAYAAAANSTKRLPTDFFGLIGGRRQVNAWRRVCQPLWERENLIVLFPPVLQAAASDLESKFTEAAIGSVQIADYRHFAHGRHHWLAKKASSTGVIALITPAIQRLADRTLHLLPASVPVARLEFGADQIESALAALSAAIMIAGFAGEERGIDPGRPGVPAFGRKIYHLRARYPRPQIIRRRIIARKCGNTVPAEAIAFWEQRLNRFVDKLSRATFRSAVFDYDGTLCDERERFDGPGPEIVRNLVTLLKKDIPIGIATGRGKSAKRDLRNVLPRSHWDKIIVGYYNGYESGLLADDELPRAAVPHGELRRLGIELSNHPYLSLNAVCEMRSGQISITPATGVGLRTLWQVIAGIVKDREFAVVISSHAIDVMPTCVSKLAVLDKLHGLFGLGSADPILCFGDRGNPPGNDALLLSQPYSLSVHEVSADPEACWNLAPPGHRGVQAMLDYFRAFRFKKNHFMISAQSIFGAKK